MYSRVNEDLVQATQGTTKSENDMTHFESCENPVYQWCVSGGVKM